MTEALHFGPVLHSDRTLFRLWAPAAKRVELLLDRALPMQPVVDGWHEVSVPGAGAGTLYRFRIDGDVQVPDPASHFQPQDVNGPSQVVDHDSYRWRASAWRGRPWNEAVMLELHVGTFTPEGTFAAAIDKLDHLVETGITAIELMPVADFAGRRNWGYDGVLLYAPDSVYGRPDDLKALVDAAHERGLMVLLDVVYNHFGPEGNYLARYAPAFFTAAHTPWGAAIDYRVPQVRAFALDNARHWLQHYGFDGLRLDAVHAITEQGEPPLLHEIGRVAAEIAQADGRQIHLVLENDNNEARWLDPHGHGKYRAQWNDDYHHAWHVLLTGESKGYYQDYADDPARHLARVLASGFAYQGEPSPHRQGRTRGEPSGALAPAAFVDFLQNHDQIGNRPLGDRLTELTSEDALAAALAVTLLAPMPPLLFMGEEWGSKRPFPFFCDFHGELAQAVRKGRREEFKAAYAALGDEIPDPLDETTFRSARLDWDAREEPGGRRRLDLVRALLDVRRREVVPRVAAASFGGAAHDAGVLRAYWPLGDGSALHLLANLADDEAEPPQSIAPARPIWGGVPPASLPAWSVFWSIGAE